MSKQIFEGIEPTTYLSAVLFAEPVIVVSAITPHVGCQITMTTEEAREFGLYLISLADKAVNDGISQT